MFWIKIFVSSLPSIFKELLDLAYYSFKTGDKSTGFSALMWLGTTIGSFLFVLYAFRCLLTGRPVSIYGLFLVIALPVSMWLFCQIAYFLRLMLVRLLSVSEPEELSEETWL